LAAPHLAAPHLAAHGLHGLHFAAPHFAAPHFALHGLQLAICTGVLSGLAAAAGSAIVPAANTATLSTATVFLIISNVSSVCDL